MTADPTRPTQNEPNIETLGWVGSSRDGSLQLIDQTLLPNEFLRIDCRSVEQVWEAIKSLRVRGAPAIGIAAAFGAVIGARAGGATSVESIRESMLSATRYLRTSRPTAVNLFWALDRMERVLEVEALSSAEPDALLDRLQTEARSIQDEDRTMCRAIGQFGAELLQSGHGVLTHCNAGGLATADYGTALAVIFSATEQGKSVHVFADETRPLLQGARLTAWELQRRGIPVTLICDSMAAQVMKEGRVDAVVVGADRIASNGDVANKIGTYSVALAARAHEIPFYVAAPSSTFDLNLPDGKHIPIELRDPKEITHGFGLATAPEGIEVYNPAFDVTPAELITAIITERGLIRPVSTESIRATLST